MESLSALSTGALAELAGVFKRLPDDAADGLIEAIATSGRIAVYGCGREGLQMKGLAMRLFHLGRGTPIWNELQRRQNAGWNSTSTVKNSSRPSSMAAVSTHLTGSDSG